MIFYNYLGLLQINPIIYNTNRGFEKNDTDRDGCEYNIYTI